MDTEEMKVKPDYKKSEKFNNAAEIDEFVEKHYSTYHRQYYSGDNTYGWTPDKDNRSDELGFYSCNTHKGYAYFPKDESNA
jgi:hypothetical protein